MRNRSSNRQSSREESVNRWEWLQNNPDPFSQQPADSDEKRREGQPGQVPPEGYPDSFGFLGWDEMPPAPSPGAQDESGMMDSRRSPMKDTQPGEKGWGPHMHPDAWLDQPLPWEMPPPGSDESRRGDAPWEPSPRQEKSKQRSDLSTPRQEKKMDRQESGLSQGRGWEDLPSLYDELEGLESPRARVKGRRTRGVRSRSRRRRR